MKHIKSALNGEKLTDGLLTKVLNEKDRKLIRSLKYNFYFGVFKVVLTKLDLDKKYTFMKSVKKLLDKV